MLLIIFFLFILLLTFFFGDRGIIEIIRTKKEIRALQESIVELETQKRLLSSDIQQLRDNPLALEREAREKLWLMKKNEKVIVIVNNKKEIRHE
jgi:cell division protein FtsB